MASDGKDANLENEPVSMVSDSKKLVVLILLGLLMSGLCARGQVSRSPATGRAAVAATSQDVEPWLRRLLKHYDSHFDPQQQLLQVEFMGPGYHSEISAGESVHPVRESFYYAVALLQRDRPQDAARAKAMLKQLLALQETKRGELGYGAWPWLLEEPLSQMGSVDLNWADFCASAIAQILVAHRRQLGDADLEKRMRVALRHAAVAIRARNVGVSYTNIAVLGGGVCVLAGEILEDKELLAYGRQRLQQVVIANGRGDSFAEYNSPPYGKVVIGECERILQLVKDREARRAAEAIRVKAWEMVAGSFHLPTQQWAGPHSRHAYRRLTTTLVAFLADRTDLPIEPHPRAAIERPRGYGIVTPLPCPKHLLDKIKQPLESPVMLSRVFLRDSKRRPYLVGRTWQDSESTIGSISRSSFWTQRQPVNGYWSTAQDKAVAFRLRFFKDGKDFASLGIRTAQEQNRVLCVLQSLPGRGDWHRSLDRPEAGIFRARDLRLRIELDGVGVRASKSSNGALSLSAGQHRLLVVPAKCQFLGEAVRWGVVNKTHLSAVEAICYSGEERDFDFRTLVDIQFAVGLELQEIDKSVEQTAPKMKLGDQRIDAFWGEMRVAVPAQ